MLPVADFYVPSNAHYFLFEMLSSRFLECNISRAASIISADQPESHPDMSVEQFNRRTRFALRDLKKVFHPLLMHLWIWSGTLLGNSFTLSCFFNPGRINTNFLNFIFVCF